MLLKLCCTDTEIITTDILTNISYQASHLKIYFFHTLCCFCLFPLCSAKLKQYFLRGTVKLTRHVPPFTISVGVSSTRFEGNVFRFANAFP